MDKTFTQQKNYSATEDSLKEGYSNRDKQCPSSETINNILNYSKALSIKNSTILENIEMVLN